MHERRKKMRDDAILLPPPATRNLASRISDTFNRTRTITRKQDSSELLPILELDDPRKMYANHRPTHSLYQGPLHGSALRRAWPRARADGHSGLAKDLEPYRTPVTKWYRQLWQADRGEPYPVPVRSSITRSAGHSATSRSVCQPHLFRAMHSQFRHQIEPSMEDIKRRRSTLIDFREVTLDLLEEIWIVLTQLDRALSNSSTKR